MSARFSFQRMSTLYLKRWLIHNEHITAGRQWQTTNPQTIRTKIYESR